MSVRVMPAQNPYSRYCECAEARSPVDDDELLLVPFSCQQTWLDQEPVELVALYYFSGSSVRYGVIKNASDAMVYWDTTHTDVLGALQDWMAEQQSPLFELNQPLPLQTVAIPKPWGQEIWYTGVEERGVACFGDGKRKVAIPYLLAVMPSIRGSAENRALILLKILDPLPEEVFGDLYFELHQEKQEVYVVTHVDETAWPDGVGQMRLGFCPKAIEQVGSDAEFRQRFLQQVLAYREVRKQIDELLDKKRPQYGLALNEEVPVKLLKSWLQDIPTAITALENTLRRRMESYYGSLPLRVGDVVKVPLNVPHSLQHGVRTIEFQTPVYERQILAFGQKVLTQEHWDTQRGVEVMEVTTPEPQQLPLLRQDEGLTVEQVVEFNDFRVERITLSSAEGDARRAHHKIRGNGYHMLIVIRGALVIAGIRLAEEEAVLLPADPFAACSSTEFRIEPDGKQPVVFLVASPNHTS